MIDRKIRRKLPKSRLIQFEWSSWDAPPSWGPQPLFAKWRLANAMRIRIGKLIVHVRAPWQEHSARALHPELFR